MAFFHDPSFWVAVAFVIFIGLAFKPASKKIREVLQNYRSQIESDFAQAQDSLTQAHLALESAEAFVQQTTETIQEIQKNTADQMRHAQDVFEEDFAHIAADDNKARAYHLDILENQLKRELRALLLTHAVNHAKRVLSQQPLGLSSTFLNTIQERSGMQETLFLSSLPGMRESILEGIQEPLDQCAHELDW